MIYYFCTRAYTGPLADYLRTWGTDIEGRFAIFPYDVLPRVHELKAGTYIFGDIERLGPTQQHLAASLADKVTRSGPDFHALNHPTGTLGRLELLQTLHQQGVNAFRADSVLALQTPARYPLFLRDAREHTGALTSLIRTKAEYNQALATLTLRGYEPQRLIAVEWCDTSDEQGVFRKYSAFRIGDRIIPRHLVFSSSWEVKTPDLLEPDHLREEQEYLDTNPHEGPLRAIFDLAGVDYGRIDYGLQEGAIQVWEINTNPIVMFPPDQYTEAHMPAQRWFAYRVRSAFEAIDRAGNGGPGVDFRLSLAPLWTRADQGDTRWSDCPEGRSP